METCHSQCFVFRVCLVWGGGVSCSHNVFRSAISQRKTKQANTMSENTLPLHTSLSQNTTPRKSRTPQIAKTAPVPRAGLRTEAEVAGGLDQEIADELLLRIEQLESENKKLRKIAAKGKGATEALRTALSEAERQQKVAQQWMAGAAALQVQLKESQNKHEETSKQLAGEAERNERLLARTRNLEQVNKRFIFRFCVVSNWSHLFYRCCPSTLLMLSMLNHRHCILRPLLLSCREPWKRAI